MLGSANPKERIVISSKSFTWKTGLTLSRNINKVISLGAGGAQANLSEKSYLPQVNDIVEKTVVGQPIGEFYGYVFDGIFSKPSDFLTHARPADANGNPYPVSAAGGGIWYGDHMYKDLNGDGIIDSRDETALGSPLPKFQYGINNTFTYKNFDLNIFFSGIRCSFQCEYSCNVMMQIISIKIFKTHVSSI